MNETSYTNQILYRIIKRQNISDEIQFFLPVYLRLNVIKNYQYNHSTGELKTMALITVTINCQNLEESIINILKQKLVVDINGQIIDFSEQNKSVIINDQNSNVIFMYKNAFNVETLSKVFLTPFQKIHGWFKIILRPIRKVPMNYHTNQYVSIRFNILTLEKQSINRQFSYLGAGYGQYTIKNLSLQCYSDYNEMHHSFQINTDFENTKEIKQNWNNQLLQKLKLNSLQMDKHFQRRLIRRVYSWHNCKFKFELNINPLVQIITIFIPLWILAGINLGIFFQQVALGGRLSEIATIILAYISYIPTIRQRIPPSSAFTMIEIIVYMLISTSILCLFGSLEHYWADPDSKHINYQWNQDIFFIICIIIDLSTFLIITAAYFHHRWDNLIYNLKQKEIKKIQIEKKKTQYFQRKNKQEKKSEQSVQKGGRHKHFMRWKNLVSDTYYKKLLDIIKPLSISQYVLKHQLVHTVSSPEIVEHQRNIRKMKSEATSIEKLKEQVNDHQKIE